MENRNNKKQQAGRRERSKELPIVYGKIPPQSKSVEEAVLGAVLIEREAFDIVSEILKPEAFYVDAHRLIFSAMVSLRQRSQPIDAETVAEQLTKDEVLETIGGRYYLDKLTTFVVSSAHTEHHCRILKEKFLKRELIRLGGELLQDAYEDSQDVFDLMDEFEKKYTDLSTSRMHNKIVGLDVHLVERYQRIQALRHNAQHITGIASGYTDLDRITHGWQNTDLIILAARPSVGKTALALNFARNAAMNSSKPVPVALFSLEMSTGQLVDRIMASESEVWLEQISNGQLSDQGMQNIYVKALQALGTSAKIYIDDTPALNLYQLRARARMLKRLWKKELGTEEGLILIDYLQLMSGSSDRSELREREVANISRGLKGLAKELHVPIIALSQLSRDVEDKKGDKTPQLKHLRESGAIEQDADMVMFLYRPEYYDQNIDALGDSTKGLSLVSIAKHRNGKLATGTEAIKLKANLAIQKFTSWEEQGSLPFISGTGLPEGKWRPLESADNKDVLDF